MKGLESRFPPPATVTSEALLVASSITALRAPGPRPPRAALSRVTLDVIDAYGFGRGATGAAGAAGVGAAGASEASKNGLSAGWLAGEALMGVRTVGVRVFLMVTSGEVDGSARGDETLGACLLDELFSRESGDLPLPLPPTVMAWALP